MSLVKRINPNRTDNLKYRFMGYGEFTINPYTVGRIYNDEVNGFVYDYNESIESKQKATSRLMSMIKNINFLKRSIQCKIN